MKILHITDPHLNCIQEKSDRVKFYLSLQDRCDILLISGDIAESGTVTDFLVEASCHLKKPIYFVLGNHDYYGDYVNNTRRRMITLTYSHYPVYYLPISKAIRLRFDTILVGQDGWADGRYGNYIDSPLDMPDSHFIKDLYFEKQKGKIELLAKMQQLADNDAMQLKRDLNLSLAYPVYPRNIIVLTHIPPFQEAYYYQGKMADEYGSPFFTSKATGDILLEFATQHSTIKIVVLSGHTHSFAEYTPPECPNLTIVVGIAEYGKLMVSSSIDIDSLEMDTPSVLSINHHHE